MIIRQKEDALFFLCQKCLNFPEQPMQCDYCSEIQCLKCIKKPQLQYKYCQCPNVYMLQEPFIYMYKQLQINCSYCCQPTQLKSIKKHEKSCYQSEQNMIKYFESMQQFSKVKQVQNYSSNQQTNQYFSNNLNIIKQCEEDIIQAITALFKCKLCLKTGNYYDMQYHYKICYFEMITCHCGWFVKRYLYQQHHISCLNNKLIKLKKEQEKVNQTMNCVLFHREKSDLISEYLDENLYKSTRFNEQRDTDEDSSDSDD